MISKEEVQKIAKLARLELTEEETEKMQKELSAILDYFDLLKKVKSAKLKVESFKTKNELRFDGAIEKTPGLADKLIEMAPDKKDRYIKVKAVL